MAKTSSLALGADGDLARSGGRFQVVKGAPYLAQKVRSVVRFWRGEYPFDLSKGFPWDEVAVGVTDPQPEIIRSELRRHIAGVQGVSTVDAVDVDVDLAGRVVSGEVTAHGDLGLLLSDSFEVPLR